MCIMIFMFIFRISGFGFLRKCLLHNDQSNSGEMETKHKQKMEGGGMRATLFVFGTIFLILKSIYEGNKFGATTN